MAENANNRDGAEAVQNAHASVNGQARIEETNITSSSPPSAPKPDITLPSPEPEEQGSSVTVNATAPAVKSMVLQRGKKKAAPRKIVRKSKWNSENILIDPTSPLAKCDLRTILSNPMAWDVLDKDEKTEILALFPDKQYIIETEDEARPDFQALLSDDSFRHDCAAYTENIAQGRHDPHWLASAWTAHERRRAGDFDDYLARKFENDWGVSLHDEVKSAQSQEAKDASEPEEVKS